MSERSSTLHVLLNERGDVLGSSYAPAGEVRGEAPLSTGRPVPAAGQRVIEVELTDELHFVDSAAALHARVTQFLGAKAKQTKRG